MSRKRIIDYISIAILIIISLCGITGRFYNMNWDSDSLLHPDEYGLTNTISQLRIPSSLSDYFNTRQSDISPYNKYDMNGEKTSDGPDNAMRWGQLPIIIIRATAEAIGQTSFSQIRQTGRYLSALMDVFSLLLLFLIGSRLFDRKIALTAVSLCSLAVQPIQQSHFMTVDNFAVFFCMLTLYIAVRISSAAVFVRDGTCTWRISHEGWRLLIAFGISLGMAMACKINLAMLGLILAPAIFIQIAELKLYSRNDFSNLLAVTITCAIIAIIAMALSLRIFQPMSFRAATGNTSFFTWNFNPDWIRSMQVAASESSGVGGGPPGEQWAHRIPILFPLINMLLYGMGFPLGLAAWVCAIVACIRIGKNSRPCEWKQLLIPLFWSLFFFLFMGTRFVKATRYFLPIYPMLCLLAAWGLLSFLREAQKAIIRILAGVLILLVFCGTGLWAYSYVSTIYGQLNTRIEASYWMMDNIPGLFQLSGTATESGKKAGINIPAYTRETMITEETRESSFKTTKAVEIDKLIMPHVVSFSEDLETMQLQIQIFADADPQQPIYETQVEFECPAEEAQLELPLESFSLEADQQYDLNISLLSGSGLSLRSTVIANENWDEALPVRLDGMDPFGQYYTGINNQVRWYDNEDKREMFIETLSSADYLILPSQRAIWSVCRIPRTYPMTMAYYQALFNGELGFELAAQFQRPFKFGPFTFSDLTGSLSLNDTPEIPVDYRGIWGAEEAFSVYDHAPVRVFRKSADFSREKLEEFFDQFDLTQMVVQGPTNADWD